MDEEAVETNSDGTRRREAEAEHAEDPAGPGGPFASRAAEGSLGPATGVARQEERRHTEEGGDRDSRSRLDELHPRRDLGERHRGRQRGDGQQTRDERGGRRRVTASRRGGQRRRAGSSGR